MAEYIDRDKTIAEIDDCFPANPTSEFSKGVAVGLAMAKVAVNHTPTADVRPVVVCANCEHNNHCLTQEFVDDCGKIPLDRNTFFCADGERRSNA